MRAAPKRATKAQRHTTATKSKKAKEPAQAEIVETPITTPQIKKTKPKTRKAKAVSSPVPEPEDSPKNEEPQVQF